VSENRRELLPLLLQTHAVEAVLPLFKAVSEEAEKCMLQMHSIDWAPAEEAAVTQTSAYMRSLAELLQGFRSQYLSHFVPQPSPSVMSFAVLLCQRLASRLITFFVRHAAMIKPLSQAGKLQLAKVRFVGSTLQHDCVAVTYIFCS
jgi:conserved oligomeric Golgi complex subunit 5